MGGLISKSTIAFRSLILLTALALAASAQIDSICADAGISPGLDSPFAHVPYVYGRVTMKGFDPAKKPPKVTVIFNDGQQSPNRFMIGSSGNYCFRRTSSNAAIVVEVDGLEVARRSLPGFGGSQQREDFEIEASGDQRSSPAAVVSAKYARSPNPATADLYKKAAEAERVKDIAEAIRTFSEITIRDSADYIAWAKLGSLFFCQEKFPEADNAFRKSLEQRIDYLPAWISVGQLRVAQKQYEAAAEIFKHAAELEPTSPMIYRLLGEAYLQAKKGSLGVEALDRALNLDPIGMAECHLIKAHLYELAGAKQFATHEYILFLQKVPQYPERNKLEKFIKDNPE
jgi:tetratricopeptide (TPR) repeat protein